MKYLLLALLFISTAHAAPGDKADIMNRLEALKDLRGAMYSAGESEPNPGIVKRDIVKDLDVSRLERLEKGDKDFNKKESKRAKKKANKKIKMESAKALRATIDSDIEIKSSVKEVLLYLIDEVIE